MTNTVPYFNQLFNCILTDLGPPGLVGWFGGAPTCMHTHVFIKRIHVQELQMAAPQEGIHVYHV